MKIHAEIVIKDEEWDELSEKMQKLYLDKLRNSLSMAAHFVGEDIATLLFNTKPFMATHEDNE